MRTRWLLTSMILAALVAPTAVAAEPATPPPPGGVAPLAVDARPDPPTPKVAAPGAIRVEGRGWGHGRGMGQYGALGYALDGWSSGRILDHFYGNTSHATTPDVDITVHLSANDGPAGDGKVVVVPGHPYEVGDQTVAAGTYTRITWDGSAAMVQTGPGCAGPWTVPRPVSSQAGTRASGPGYRYVAITPGAGASDDPADLAQICQWSRDGVALGRTAYRGALWASKDDGRSTWVGNRVNLETYLMGVVPRESPPGWGSFGGGAGQAALEAQAVAARSYAVRLSRVRRAGTWATDTCDTQACQVYAGAWSTIDGGRDHGGTKENTRRAVRDTAGHVRAFGDGRVALTEFASSTGGWTSDQADGNPFGAVVDEGDSVSANPNHTWSTTIPRAAIEARWPSLGTLESIEVTDRNGLGAWGGRVEGIRLVGSDGNVDVGFGLSEWSWSNDPFRRAFGLRSDWYRFPDFLGGAAPAPPPTSEPDPAPDPPARPRGEGFWVVRADGAVGAFGDAAHAGDAAGLALNQPIVGMAVHPSGRGYWLLGRDGGIFSYGRAGFHGSTGSLTLNEPVVAMAPHPSGEGYWFAASDGGIFNYGRAGFHGSTGDMRLVSPVVGMAPTPTGRGYWLVAADGGVFAFGDARFHGSIGGSERDDPVVGMATLPSGQGYWIITRGGDVFAFGAAEDHGSAPDGVAVPVIGMAVPMNGEGYWLVRSDGLSYTRGSVIDHPSSRFGGPIAGTASLP